jgi:hypothetical protein
MTQRCPLLGVGKPVGFLFFTSFSKHAYQEEHCDVFIRLAATLSVAVEKSHIYQELLKEQQTVSDLLNSLFPTSMVPRLLRPEDKTQIFSGIASIVLVSYGMPLSLAIHVYISYPYGVSLRYHRCGLLVCP